MLAILSRPHCDKTLFPGSKLEDDPIECDIYTLLCMAMFMEFIPVEHIDEEQPETLFMDQVLILLTESLFKSLWMDSQILTWLLIGWRLCRQPIRSHVRKLLIVKGDFNRKFVSNTKTR